MKRYVSSLPFNFYLTCSLAVVRLLDDHLYSLSLGNWFHLHPGSRQHSGEWQHHTHRQKVRPWMMRLPGDSGFCYCWGSGTKGTLKGVSKPDNNLATVLFIRGSCHSYPHLPWGPSLRLDSGLGSLIVNESEQLLQKISEPPKRWLVKHYL